MLLSRLCRNVLLSVASLASAPVLAQSPGSPAATSVPVRQESAAGPRCAAERDWVEAERTTPGVLLVMAHEALAACEGTTTAAK